MKGTSPPSLLVVAALLVGAAACDDRAPSFATHALPTTALYSLLFDGATVTSGSVDDPPTISRLAAGTSPAFDAAIVAPRLTDAAARAAIARRVASYFAPYAFDALPDAGAGVSQNFVIVGGASDDLTPTPSALVAGLAPLDCGDVEARNLGWVFAGELPPAFGGVLAVSATAAHEIGHMVGLEHTRDLRDVMYADSAPQQMVPDLFALRFGAGEQSITGEVGFRCGFDTTIDNHQRLLDRLGASADRGVAPTLTWTAPLAGSVPGLVGIVADVAADGPVIVEVWRNFELYAELTAPPYELQLPLDAEVTFVTLDVFGDNGLHTSETRRLQRVTMDLAVPVADGGADLRGAVDLGGTPPDESCSCNAAPRAPSWSIFLIIWSIYLTSRRRPA